jgi:hypothetical protein
MATNLLAKPGLATKPGPPVKGVDSAGGIAFLRENVLLL